MDKGNALSAPLKARRSSLLVWAFGFGLATTFADLATQLVPRDKELPWGGGSALRLVAVFVVSGAVFALIAALSNRFAKTSPSRSWKWRASAFFVPLACWGILLAHLWPAVSMNDSWWIIADPVGASNQHPLAYGIYLRGLTDVGKFLLGTYSHGLAFTALVQMCLCAAVVAFMADTLDWLGAPRVVWGAFVGYMALMPLVGDYAIALVKDSPFVIALAGLAPFLIRIWHSRGRAFNSVYFAVAFFLDLVFVGAMRNNGLAVVAVLLVVIFVISGKFRFRAVTVTLLALVVACLPSQVSKHYVGEHKYVESVSMPLQMIGYGQWAHRDCIPVSTQRYFARIMPPQKWADVYWAQSVDATKDSPDFDKKFLQETKKDFPRHFLNYVKSCPAAAAKGYLIHTRTYWSPLTLPLGKTEQSLFTSLVSNKSGATAAIVARLKDQGVANHSLLPKTLDAPVQAWFSIGTKYLPGPGTWMWLLLGILVGFFYRSCVAEGVLVVLPAVLIYLTLLVASPVAFPFRYVAFLAFYAPFAAAVLTIRPSCQAVAESKIKDRLLSE